VSLLQNGQFCAYHSVVAHEVHDLITGLRDRWVTVFLATRCPQRTRHDL